MDVVKGMEMYSIKDIYKIGRGPSSSHTMGPEKACCAVLNENPEADRFEVTLFGSLAKTGKGHRTDYAIEHHLGLTCDPVNGLVKSHV